MALTLFHTQAQKKVENSRTDGLGAWLSARWWKDTFGSRKIKRTRREKGESNSGRSVNLSGFFVGQYAKTVEVREREREREREYRSNEKKKAEAETKEKKRRSEGPND